MTSDYVEVPVEIVSGHYQSRSKMMNSQKCINMYIETQSTGRSPKGAMCWPGEKLLSAGDADSYHQGMIRFNASGERLYFVRDNKLYRMLLNGEVTEVVDGVFGADRLEMATDNFHILIRTGGSIAYFKNNFVLAGTGQTYIWDGTSLEILDIPNGGLDRFTIATLEDTIQPDSPDYLTPVFNGVRTYKVNADLDEILQIYTFQEKLYVGGRRGIQIFYSTDDANTPLLPYDQAISDGVGVGSQYSMASSNSYLYFLGSDNNIYRMASAQVENITPGSIAAEIRRANDGILSVVTKAVGTVVSLEGQHFYILNAPADETRGKPGFTIVYSETTGEFTRLQTGLDRGAHLMHSYQYVYGKHIVSDIRNGNIYEWDFDTFTSNGETMLRQIDTQPINGSQIGVLGDQMIFGYMDLKVELGVGNNDFPNPMLQVEYSIDGGLTFKTAQSVPLQAAGQKFYRARWNDCFVFYDLVIRLKVTSGVFVGFHSASIAIQKGGY